MSLRKNLTPAPSAISLVCLVLTILFATIQPRIHREHSHSDGDSPHHHVTHSVHAHTHTHEVSSHHHPQAKPAHKKELSKLESTTTHTHVSFLWFDFAIPSKFFPESAKAKQPVHDSWQHEHSFDEFSHNSIATSSQALLALLMFFAARRLVTDPRRQPEHDCKAAIAIFTLLGRDGEPPVSPPPEPR